jgi:hypothetical protein
MFYEILLCMTATQELLHLARNKTSHIFAEYCLVTYAQISFHQCVSVHVHMHNMHVVIGCYRYYYINVQRLLKHSMHVWFGM